MSAFAALVLYPLWSVALATGLVALRLGRSARTGLVVLCALLAAWVVGLVLLASGSAVAERVLPFGMLLAGAFVHAGTDVAKVRAPRVLMAGYGWGAVVALLGALAPELLYAHGARAAGPLFWPVGVISAAGTALALLFLARLVRSAGDARDRRRRVAVFVACAAGAAGGGAVIGLRVVGLGDVPFAAPFLTVATLLAGYATFAGEEGRARELVVQGATQAFVTALLSTVGLTAFYLVLPALTPGGGTNVAWLAFVVFLAALPLEPLRMLVVERVGRALFRRPTNVPDLAASVEQSEARADHAERLAELGRVVSAVAHEIRNPLGVIAAQAKLLERRGADPALVADVRAQVERTRRFLDDLLRYGKARPLEARTFEVAAVMALAVSNVRQAFGADAPTVTLSVEGTPSATADRAAFSDTLAILVHNACIAAAAATLSSTPSVTVTARDDGEALLVTVEDSGAGVPKELEATLFQPFVTGRGRDAKHPGTGLGLAIAARWAERHGGSIHHERAPGGGARFVVRWPHSLD